MNDSTVNLVRERILGQIRIILEPWLSSDDPIDENTDLLSDLGVDSVGVLQLVLGVEKEFDITIKDHELDSNVFSKMRNFIDIIESKVNENN
jgi:acyl carrier protein